MGYSLLKHVKTSLAAATLLAAAAYSLPAAAQQTLIAFTPTAAAGGIFNAQAEGFFKKAGMPESGLLTQANGVGVVAAVQSKSAQIGSVALGVFYGAIENGLDYVALGCQSLFGPGTDVLAVIARKGSTIKAAKDFEGKRVAVPGISGGHHIMFLEWLKSHGADAKKVTFLEVAHAQQADVLRGRTVDAVVTAEPNVVRIINADLGDVVSRLNDMKRNMPDAFFMATREWADANPDKAVAFQKGLAEGVAFADANPDKTSENTAHFLKQNVDIVRQAGKQKFCTADLTRHINEANAIMTELGLVKQPLDANRVIWKRPG
jgi:NitT/TauT family transport system substrate-binding protein